jgi:LytS/YehU family sensor histidine kinase
VQLEKELAVMLQYIKLEENAVPENLQMNIDMKGQIAGKYITPLILLSLVEAGFEYFLEKRPIKFSSKLFIDIEKDQLSLRLLYESPDDQSLESIFSLDEKFQGIRKQLNNLYEDNNMLGIESNPGHIVIVLKNLPLHNKSLEKELQTIKYSYENV